MNPGPGPFFPKFLTPVPGPKEKRRILPESTPTFRIRSHLCSLVLIERKNPPSSVGTLGGRIVVSKRCSGSGAQCCHFSLFKTKSGLFCNCLVYFFAIWFIVYFILWFVFSFFKDVLRQVLLTCLSLCNTQARAVNLIHAVLSDDEGVTQARGC